MRLLSVMRVQPAKIQVVTNILVSVLQILLITKALIDADGIMVFYL